LLLTSPMRHRSEQAVSPHADGNNADTVCNTLQVLVAAHHQDALLGFQASASAGYSCIRA